MRIIEVRIIEEALYYKKWDGGPEAGSTIAVSYNACFRFGRSFGVLTEVSPGEIFHTLYKEIHSCYSVAVKYRTHDV